MIFELYYLGINYVIWKKLLGFFLLINFYIVKIDFELRIINWEL